MKKPETADKEFLLPNVRVRSGPAGGSGTVIYSQPANKGGHSTYILTNEHVVCNSIEQKTRWSSLLHRDVKDDVRSAVEVEFFKFAYESRAVGSTAIKADIVAYDKDEDIALLKLQDLDPAAAVAKLYPKDTERELRLLCPLITIGCGLGEPPVLTAGLLSQFGRLIENREYWLSTAPTIFGNSGGAVYLANTRQLIGIPARMPVLLMGLGADCITHLSWLVPITRVYKFLEAQKYRFIYAEGFTEESEEAERERIRTEEELRIAARERLGQRELGK